MWFLHELLDRCIAYYGWLIQHQNHFAFFAAVFGIIGGATAVYRIWVGWERTRRKLFLAYLNAQEQRILESKTSVANRLHAAPAGPEMAIDVDVHADIEAALRLCEKGKQPEALIALRVLQSKVDLRHEFAEKQAKIARLQIAAIHLFVGSLRAAARDTDEAIEEFKKALAKSPHDTDALKYLGAQYLILSSTVTDNKDGYAQDALATGLRLEQAAKLADLTNRKEAEVEAFKLQGQANAMLDRPGKAVEALKKAVDLADWASDHHLLVAEVNELLGDIELGQSHWVKAEESYSESADRFLKAGDVERADIVREKKRKAVARGVTAEQSPAALVAAD